MYHWFYKNGRKLAIYVIVVLVLVQFLNRCEPYGFAQNRINSSLQSNPDFESRLRTYGNLAREWEANLKPATDTARLILMIIEFLGREDALKAAGDIMPGGRVLLNNLVTAAQNLVRLDTSLEKVSTANITAISYQNLKNQDRELTREELVQVCDDSTEIASGLINISSTLGEASESIRAVTENAQMESILWFLDKSRAMVPNTENLPNDMYRGIAAWEASTVLMDSIKEQIEGDVATLNSIQNWCNFAYYSDYALNSLAFPIGWVNSNLNVFLFLLAVGIAVAVGTRFGMFVLDQVRWHGLTRRPKVIIVDKRSKKDGSNQSNNGENGPNSKQELPGNHAAKIAHISPTAQEQQAVLICNWLDGRHKTVILPRDGKITIGCDALDDLLVDSKNATASQIMIRRARMQYYFQVLDNRLPTKLNGQVVQGSRIMNDRDSIQVGDLTAVFLNAAPPT